MAEGAGDGSISSILLAELEEEGEEETSDTEIDSTESEWSPLSMEASEAMS